MSGLNLIPTDLVTQQMLVEVLTAMVKHHIATKKVTVASGFLRPTMTMADTLSAQTEMQPDSTTVAVSRQSGSECGVMETIKQRAVDLEVDLTEREVSPTSTDYSEADAGFCTGMTKLVRVIRPPLHSTR